MSDISKHVSMGRIYAACQMLERLPGSETATAISILLSDAMRDIETLVDSRSTEGAAAISSILGVVKEYIEADDALRDSAPDDNPTFRRKFDRKRAADVALRALPATPAVDVLGVVRRWRDARAAWDKAHEANSKNTNPEARRDYILADAELDEAESALCALVDGAPAKPAVDVLHTRSDWCCTNCGEKFDMDDAKAWRLNAGQLAHNCEGHGFFVAKNYALVDGAAAKG